ncbi:HD family hydrolase [Poseidonocella sp. HB161398]|uniref:HD domain-containing protein n=1 Tax=Poseidonocella sp. HB161398 TaxID=2320855 RepID=UPI001F10A97B|nr:HD domain-containing protein [Poseidonocella sp. HB161398]
MTRLDRQIAFLMEAERLRKIERSTPIGDGSRPENSAEHSWHLALFALVLGEHGAEGIDLNRVIRMLILHDIVEVDAGDNPIHGNVDTAAQEAAEKKAADRLYGLLPEDQGAELRALWDEFEAEETPEAQFAKALDRFQPPLLNLATDGVNWKLYEVTPEKIERRIGRAVERGAPGLWSWLWPRITGFFAGTSAR